MRLQNKAAIFYTFIACFERVIGEVPTFRVLAPEFVCPDDEESPIDKPDSTIITIRASSPDLQFSWTVRWTHLDAPSQRLTLLLWRTVRNLERKLNASQPEPFVYVINNAELLKGVEYIFNVTATDPNSGESTSKSFLIDNIKGDQKLTIEGRSDKFSVLLLGAETVYTDMEYIVEAVVTTCLPIQDYYFVWSIQGSSTEEVNVTTPGSRLEMAPYSLKAGSSYFVSSTVYRSDHEFVTQTGLPFQVLYRGLKVKLNFDELLVTVNNGFTIEALIENHDFYMETPSFEWISIFEDQPCKNFNGVKGNILMLSDGLPDIGKYIIELRVRVKDQKAVTNATIYTVVPNLPMIQIRSVPRIVNEHKIVTVVANATNVVPTCSLTWYFADEELLSSQQFNNTCESCQHGAALADSLVIFSLEENFLNEITDFTNETEWRQVSAEITAATGRARFVAQCGCSLTFNCETEGTVYADAYLELNESPKLAHFKITPEIGTAMETVFRISTFAASDPDIPLRYTFFCSLGYNNSLVLGSNLEYLAIESLLPYYDETGTEVWIEVCDSLGGCAASEVKIVRLFPGTAKTLDSLGDSLRGHVARCEVLLLRRLVMSAVTTYINAKQVDALAELRMILEEALPEIQEDQCNSQEYSKLLDWVDYSDLDVTELAH